MVLVLTLAACAQAPLPPPPLPPAPPVPPPVAIVIPPRPTPPDGASPQLRPPPVTPDGTRESVNRKLTPNQAVWNLRSAYTVAALNCRDPRNGTILPRYRQFLAAHARALTGVYAGMEREFRERHGRGGEALRDDYLTALYNHYALPPTQARFCDVIDQIMRDGETVPSAGLAAFALTMLPAIEAVFDQFYDRYDQYRLALADWDARYGRISHVRLEPLP